MSDSTFSKYDERGAYHWAELEHRLPTRYSARLHALYGWFVEETAAHRPGLVVDVGCGDAALSHRMAEATPGRVVGIEPEDGGVEMARGALSAAGSRVEVLQGRGEDLPFGDGEADQVVMCEVVEHLEPIEPLLAEAGRVLSDEGALLVSTPQWQQPQLRRFHVREFRWHELRDTLAPFFEEVTVLVSEPPDLYDAYASSTSRRVSANVRALAGRNPFGRRRVADDSLLGWRELHAIGRRPRR